MTTPLPNLKLGIRYASCGIRFQCIWISYVNGRAPVYKFISLDFDIFSIRTRTRIRAYGFLALWSTNMTYALGYYSKVFSNARKYARQKTKPAPVARSDAHNQQFVSWIYLYAITAAAENTLIWMGNTFLTCVFFESKTNRTSVQTDCTILVFSK